MRPEMHRRVIEEFFGCPATFSAERIRPFRLEFSLAMEGNAG
jgi:hypothetical protein